MSATNALPALPLRAHTFLGVCEGIGEDFGFNPIYLRVPLGMIVLYSPIIAIGTYFALGLVVLASRLIFPTAKAMVADAAAKPAPAADTAEELKLAA